jgi:D-alanine-D-alanine ligase
MKLAFLYTKSELTPWKENVSHQTLAYLVANTPAHMDGQIEHFDGFDLEMVEKLRKYDLVFNVCYGYYDADQVDIARWLEQMRLPHTASSARRMELAGDKKYLPLLCRQVGLHTPEFITLESVFKLNDDFLYLSKPAKGSCHRDIFINSGKWMKNHTHLLPKDAIIQKYISGREFSVAVIPDASLEENLALPPVEIIPEDEQNIYIAGSQFGKTKRDFEPSIDFAVRDALMEAALRMHRIIQLKTMSRTDFRMADDGTIYVLDVNAMPNLDPQKSLMPEICRRNGIPISELIRRVVECSKPSQNVIAPLTESQLAETA